MLLLVRDISFDDSVIMYRHSYIEIRIKGIMFYKLGFDLFAVRCRQVVQIPTSFENNLSWDCYKVSKSVLF